MHPAEVQMALAGARVVCDTREQPNPRLRERLKQIGLPVERRALPFGDYSIVVPLPDGNELDLSDKVVVERKMGADEIIMCYTRERDRFEREFERAKEAGARIYLLLENCSWEIFYGGRYRSRMKPRSLVSSIWAWVERYDCIPLMCNERSGGLVIRDCLLWAARERLNQLDGGEQDEQVSHI